MSNHKFIRRRKRGNEIEEKIVSIAGPADHAVARTKSPENPVIVDNIFYRNLRSFASENGYSYNRVLARFLVGKEGKDLIPFRGDIDSCNGKGMIVTVGEETFSSLAMLARKYDLNYQIVYGRYKAGVRGEDLVAGKRKRARRGRASKSDNVKPGIEVQVGDRVYSSITEVAREHGINPGTAYARYNRGLRGEELVTGQDLRRLSSGNKPLCREDAAKRGRPASPITLDGVRYRSAREAATKLKVSVPTIRNRLKKQVSAR